MSRICGTHGRGGGRETHTGFLLVSMKERDNLQDLDIDVRITFKWILQKQDGREIG
jgi:hypothetical protein